MSLLVKKKLSKTVYSCLSITKLSEGRWISNSYLLQFLSVPNWQENLHVRNRPALCHVADWLPNSVKAAITAFSCTWVDLCQLRTYSRVWWEEPGAITFGVIWGVKIINQKLGVRKEFWLAKHAVGAKRSCRSRVLGLWANGLPLLRRRRFGPHCLGCNRTHNK